MPNRTLHDIACEIDHDWHTLGKGVSPYARPYLDAMADMVSINDNYGADSGASIVGYFLANAGSWRGETAKRIKAELKAMLKGAF